MDFVTPLQRILQSQATLEHTRASTEDTRALAGQRQIQQMILGEQLQETLATNQALKTAFGGNIPVMPPQLSPDPDDSPTVATQKNVARLQWEAKNAQEFSSTLAQKGAPARVVLDFQKRAIDAGRQASYAAREAMQERNDVQRDIGGWARGVNDEDSFKIFVKNMQATDPKALQQMPLDRDQFGTPVYGPRSQVTTQSVGRMAQDANQQTKAEIAATTAEARAKDAETRAELAQNRAQLLDATTALKQAQAGYYTNKADDVLNPKARPKAGAANAGPKAATQAQTKAANSMIDGEFEGASFDGTRTRFAADIADRANKIVSDAKARGENVSYDDARQDAFDQLKGYVTDKKQVIKEGMTLPIIGTVGREERTVKTYARGNRGAVEPAAGTLPLPKSQNELVSGKVYNTSRGPAKWNGTVFEAVQ